MAFTDELNPVFIKIALEDIVYLKAILEGYEELGVIRTLNRLAGEIVILSPASMSADLELLLQALQSEIQFRIIPPPQDICEDWLLSEYLETEA